MQPKKPSPYLEDDSKEAIFPLITHRLPWLLVGFAGGVIITIFTSHFQYILEKNIQLAFFIPIIVYMSSAVGTQTETIYIRNLIKKQINFWTYFFKELAIGASLGLALGILLAAFAYFWFNSPQTAITVGLAMFANVTLAPIISLIIPELLQKERTDPALGAGPFTTVLSDLCSLLIYFAVASVIIFKGI